MLDQEVDWNEGLMTEAEWLASSDPRPMLEFLCPPARSRRVVLFFDHCFGRFRDWIDMPDAREMAGRLARLADNLPSEPVEDELFARAGEVLQRAVHRHVNVEPDSRGGYISIYPIGAVTGIAETLCHSDDDGWTQRCYQSSLEDLLICAWLIKLDPSISFIGLKMLPDTYESLCYAHLLRDIFGNPFHPVAVDPSWRTSAVVALATSIYSTANAY